VTIKGDLKPMANVKQAICICCGKDIEVSLFMSFVKAKCDRCKEAKASVIDEHMVRAQELQAASKGKRKTTTTINEGGNTKESVCIECGATCEIGKFSSHKTAKCQDCKGSTTTGSTGPVNVTVNMAKLDRSKIPSIEQLRISPIIIKNVRLQNPDCPACETKMDPLNVMEASLWGLAITYQCPRCFGAMSFSEQTRHKIRPNPNGTWFSYTGREIKGMIPTKDETIVENTIQHLLDLLEERGMPIEDIEGIKLPPWFNAISRKEFESLKEGIDYGFNSEEEILNGGNESEQVC